MRTGLIIFGIFLAVATMMAATIGFWNHFPGWEERRWRSESAALAPQVESATSELKELTQQMQAAVRQHNAATSSDAVRSASADSWLKDRALADPLAAKLDALTARQKECLESMDLLSRRRHITETVCFWVSLPLAIFTALSFTLAFLLTFLRPKQPLR